MRKRKILLASCILAGIVGFSYYSQVAFKSNTEIAEENKANSSKEEATGKVKYEEAFDYDKVLNSSYDNIEFKDDAFCGFDEIASKKITNDTIKGHKYFNQYKIDYDSIFKKWIKIWNDEKNYDSKQVINDKSTTPFGPFFKNEKYYFTICETGFLSCENQTEFNKIDTTEDEDECDFKLEKMYFVKGNYTDSEYETLNNSKMKVSDVVNLANEAVQKRSKDVGIDYTDKLELYGISVYKNQNNKVYFLAEFQQKFKGICTAYVNNKFSKIPNDYLGVSGAVMYFTGTKERDLISTTIDSIYDTEKQNEVSDIYSFSEATKLLNNNLNGHKKYYAKHVTMEYLVTDNSESENPENEDTYVIPCWTYYFDTTKDQEIVAYVNAITGEVNFVCNQ